VARGHRPSDLDHAGMAALRGLMGGVMGNDNATPAPMDGCGRVVIYTTTPACARSYPRPRCVRWGGGWFGCVVGVDGPHHRTGHTHQRGHIPACRVT
jgi:hypothetical protein